MIKQIIKLDRYDWTITMYYAVHSYHVDDIIGELCGMGIRGKMLASAYKHLSSGKVDTGLTYVNDGRALCVIGKASDASEYANSIQHEIMHLAIFIAMAEGIPLESEEVCYIGGEIAQKAHPKTKLLTSKCGCYTDKIGKTL